MSKELYFDNELRKCLDAAGFSDCGENDQWNYWYHRVHKAHDQAVDRVTKAQRTDNAKLREEFDKMDVWHSKELTACMAENAKLRELVRDMQHAIACLVVLGDDYAGEHEDELCALDDRMRELEVDE